MDNTVIADIRITTTSRWILTSRPHANTQSDKENTTKVTELWDFSSDFHPGGCWVGLVESSVGDCVQPGVLC